MSDIPKKKNIVYLERQVDIVPLRDFRQTEETVCQKKIDEMMAAMKDEGFFPAPLIASRNPVTQQILTLDGNHRRQVGELMGLKYLPVIFIGWDEFGIDVWNRSIVVDKNKVLEKLFRSFGLSQSDPEINPHQALLHFRGKNYVFGEHDRNKLKQHKKITGLFDIISTLGLNI